MWLALLLVGTVTLVPGETTTAVGGGSPGSEILCLLCGKAGLAEALANVLLFVPLGVAAGRLKVSLGRGSLYGVGLALGIELVQFVVPGRHPALGDLVANSAGMTTGLALVAWLPVLLRSTGTRAAWLSLLWGAVASAAVLVSGLLFEPDLPASTYYGQWTPRLGHLAPYGGRVLEARVGDRELPAGRLADSPLFRRLLLEGASIQATIRAGKPPAALAPIVSVYDEDQREIFLLGLERQDLVFRIRRLADGLRLGAPEVRYPGAFDGVEPGDSLQLRVENAESGYCLTVDARRRCDLGPGPGAAWTLFAPPDMVSQRLSPVLDVVWMALLVFPLGFWLRRRWPSGLALMCLGAVLVLVPLHYPVLFPSLWEVGGITAGLLTGAALRALKTRRRGLEYEREGDDRG